MKPILYKPKIYQDSRGLFFEAFSENELFLDFVQDNISISKKGVVRGMHYQIPPMEQGKLLRVIKGSIYDLAIDLRSGEQFSVILDGVNHHSLYIPPGYAHGFQALEDDTILYYKCTHLYSKDHEQGINPNHFKWPISITEMSDKDKNLP